MDTSYYLTILIFLIIYIFISIQRFPFIKIDRPAGVFTGVTLLILFGVITLEEGYSYIDFNVITFLLGMMIMVSYLQKSGFFSLAASITVKNCNNPKTLLIGTIISSAILSALFVNDTVCLLITPIIISAVQMLKINPMPYLSAVAISSNIGSGLTVTGNPQNMYIGIKTGISFIDFSIIASIPVLLSLVATYFVIKVIYSKDLKYFSSIPQFKTFDEIDKKLMIKSLLSLFVTMILFISGVSYPFAALIGATLIILLAGIRPANVFKNIDWPILLFFAGLFITMGAFEKMGYISSLIDKSSEFMENGSLYSLSIFSSIALLISNAVSNVPAVILMLPVVENSINDALLLSLISTFAGNLTLVGSVANLIVAERAESCKINYSFVEHLKTGVPITIISCIISIIYIYLLR